MNAFSDIDALLRVISREKGILRFLFVSRKAPSLRREQELENFLSHDTRRLEYLLEHGVIREADGLLVLEDTYLRFFEEVLEVNEEINVLSVKQHIDALNENIELWLTVGSDARRHRYMGEILRILRSIALSTHRNVIDLKRAIDSTYKNERKVQRGMNDFRYGVLEGRRFCANDVNILHNRCVDWLKKALEASSAKTRVVVTHHCPTVRGAFNNYPGGVLNSAFQVDMDDFIEKYGADYWLYGHTHYAGGSGTVIGRTKLLCNQMGYVCYGENRDFVTNAVIEV